jgi:hypothetical protein
MGIMAILKRNPIIKAIEHTNSVNMVSIKANCLLNPSMDGKVLDRVEKFSSLSIPCSIKSMPNMSLKESMTSDMLCVPAYRGNKIE